MAADGRIKAPKRRHILISACAVLVFSFMLCAGLSFWLHIRMIMQTVAGTSQVACGQAAQNIVYGLSYGKEISNYSGMDALLEEVAMLGAELKNVYVCDTDGVIWGSHIKMMEDTVRIGRPSAAERDGDLRIQLHATELHVLQALKVDGQTVGYIGAVTDIQTAMQPLHGRMRRELGASLLCGALAAMICTAGAMRWKASVGLLCALIAAVELIPACTLHLNTQRSLLETQLTRQARVMVETINADAAKLTRMGIDIGDTDGLDRYLSEKIAGQPAISNIELENKLNGELYAAQNTQRLTTAYTEMYSDFPFFTVSIGIAKEEYDRYEQTSIRMWGAALAIGEALILLSVGLLKSLRLQGGRPD